MSKKRKSRPTPCGGLRVALEGREIVIRLDISGLKEFYAPDAFDRHFGVDEHTIKVTSNAKFAREVVRELLNEREDGATPVTELFDKAFCSAVENGAAGVDYERKKGGAA